MHKTQTALASAIALSLLLSGCSSLDRINQTITQSDSDYGIAKGHLGQLSSGSPVQDLTAQWINPVPLNSPSQTQAQLPGCALTLTRPGDVSLAEISAFITRTCKLPVVVTPDAQAAMTTGQGKTEKIQGSVPAPDASGMVPLNAIGGGVPVTRDVGNMGNTLRGVYWQGSLSGLLDNVTTRLGLSWRYEQGRISIFYVNTKTFPVMFMDSKTAFSSKVVSGTTTSSGTSGGSSGGGMSGDVNTSQTTTMEMTSGLYNDLQNTIKAMLTPGVGRLFLAAGMLTVTDTPRVLDAVGHYIDDRNMELNRQVVLNVKVFSVEKRRQDQLGIDWNAVFTSGSVGGSLASAFTDASTSAMTGGLSILDGKFANSKAFVNGLAEQANVSLVTQQASTTTNMSAVPVQVGTQQDYASQVNTDSTANVGTSTSITKSTITTGFNMTMLPYIMPNSPKIELQFSINMSDDPTSRTFTSGESSIELMKTRLKTFNQRVILSSGQTLVLSGFQQVNNTSGKQGVGSASFFGLGGGANGQKDDTMLVILITPTLLR
ncbi:PilN family type IVB pilus formation outer membrane protein (plasmid) [Erwinia tracheiphila]|uniref:PilN family type IVB pilus formation outer membrane protein n=1 Tax=Erwinia tracheiphila TaxID=65700 RepID=A0A345CZX2_9GAMM|nr:PilN family type IVB pilus formation outer membrane protein [Erwinia tracheiphila]AXF78989.1 PilN family type IVB pilus formation outer membrane protein [Erwinia tracheiphila]UIA85888.1 PilN family type IVB pilus formation outer membrane protein [Erwinia tracheiphila]